MMGMAVLTLTSCTNEEVLKAADGRAIGFDAFVGNTTKAVTEVKTLTNFYVFGNFSADEAAWNGQIFNNEPNTAVYYWQQGKHYRFGAYANGEAGQIADARYDAATQVLTFPDYTPDDTKDLVAAITTADASQAIPTEPVSLSFGHMLSQVGFTFNTEVGKEYTLAIRNIKINKAIRTATGTYEAPATINWQGKAEPAVAYVYNDIADLAGEETNKASQFKLVIPQQVPTEGASQITVSFTASISGGGLSDAAEKTFEIELASPGEGGWKPGFRYNYTATINGDNITNMKPVEFTPSVGEWEDGNTTEVAPQKIISSYIRPNFYETNRVYTESMNACNDLIFMTASPYANGDIYFETPDNTATFSEGATSVDEFKGKKGVMAFNGQGEMNAGYGLLNSATQGVNQFTFATWLYIDEWTNGATLFAKTGNANEKVTLTLGQNPGTLAFCIDDQTATLTNSKLATGEWMHIAMTYGNKGTLHLYVNGEEAPNSSTTIGKERVTFMQTETKLGKGLKGYMEETYFNFLPLGGGDIRTVMKANGNLPYSSWNMCKTQAYWTFDTTNPSKDDHTWVSILNDVRSKLNPGIKLRIGIASGGWQAMCNSPQARQKFAENVKKVLETYRLDGVDLDFEWPANNESAFNTYNQTVIALRNTIGYDYTFSVSLHPVSYKMSLDAAKVVDFISIQAYGPSPERFPYDRFVADTQLILDWGFPKDKIVMGVPFYGVTKDGSKSTEAYWSFVQEGLVTSTAQSEVTYKNKLFIYDSVDAIRKKTKYTMDQGLAGMMSWDLATDVTLSHEYSLLRAMLKEIPAMPQ